MSKNKKRTKSVVKQPVPAPKENAGTFLYWILGALATGMLGIILYYVMRNRSDLSLNGVKSESSFDIATNPHTFDETWRARSAVEEPAIGVR